MELRINLATASLKDAEHAIFLIGAYFGMTNLPSVGPRITVSNDVTMSGSSGATFELPKLPGDAVDSDPAAVFGAGQQQPDPAAVFGGNGATGQVGLPGSPAVAPSVPPAAAPAVGSVGNVPPAPTVPAPAGTPATPPAPAVSAPPGVELDTKGLPWDARIHASGEGGTKPKNKDGTWRQRRGVQPLDVNKVEAELRQTMAAGVPATPPAPPAPQVPPPPAPPVPPPQLAAPSAHVPLAPPVPPAAGPAPDPTTFEQLMPRVTDAIMHRGLPQNALLLAVQAYALPAVTALATRPDMVPSVWLYLKTTYPEQLA